MEVRDGVEDNNKLTLFAPSAKITGRGDTLNRPQLTVELTSPMEDIIKVKMYHHKGGVDNSPRFELNETSTRPIIQNTKDSVSFKSGNLEFSIKDNKKWETLVIKLLQEAS